MISPRLLAWGASAGLIVLVATEGATAQTDQSPPTPPSARIAPIIPYDEAMERIIANDRTRPKAAAVIRPAPDTGSAALGQQPAVSDPGAPNDPGVSPTPKP